MPKERLYSFDVFDTLITRTTATPSGIFALMEERLKSDDKYADIPLSLRNNFYTRRENAEACLRSPYFLSKRQEITLSEIYKLLSTNAFIDSNQEERLLQLELETELSNIVGIERNITRVRELIKAGRRVILISDMYLPAEAIRKLLLAADPIFKEIKIYASSEYNKTKWSGDLFEQVRQVENARFDNWIHTGDNPHSDHSVPQKLGIQSEQYCYPGLEAYETGTLNTNPDDSFVQLTIGTARNSKITQCADEMTRLGTSLGGAMLFPYVWWVLESAKKLGLKKLYFVARDGYVLKEIADVIIRENQLSIKTYYVYGSRRAWRLAGYGGTRDFCVDGYFWPVASPNLEELLFNLELPSKEVLPYLPKRFHNPNRKFSVSDLRQVKTVLFSNAEFVKLFNEKTQVLHKNVSQYLHQIIDFTDKKLGFVEFRGSGKTQDSLANIIHEEHDNQIYSFFLTFESAESFSGGIKYMFFPAGSRYVHDILEPLTRAPHGQTVGYDKLDDKVMPILEKQEGEGIINVGFYDYLDGVIRFSEDYCKLLKSKNINPMELQLFREYFTFLINTPDKNTANLIGRMPFSFGSYVKHLEEYAPPFSLPQILTWGLLGYLPKRILWYKGRWARTSQTLHNLFITTTNIRLFCEKYIFDIRIKPEKKIVFIKVFGIKLDFGMCLGVKK